MAKQNSEHEVTSKREKLPRDLKMVLARAKMLAEMVRMFRAEPTPQTFALVRSEAASLDAACKLVK